ncbi:retrotransposon protein, putative, ty1-copia subclass [Tanacetum coccineum]
MTRIGKYDLMLKSGVRIDLNNCYYSSEMTGNIILFHALFKDASLCKGIYEAVECISNNDNVILNVGSSNELDKSKLWHSRLGYVNKKRIAQLQKDGVLESFDFKLDDLCESCLLGKMTNSPFTGTCERARRGVFFEREMISKEDSRSKIDLEEIQEISSKVRKPPQFYYGFHIEENKINDSTLSELDEPANCKEVMASPESAKWKEAIKSEIQSMYDNQDWNLVDTTPGLKMVGCKWIFKKKTNMDGKVHAYKARLVVKGYTQTHGIDYKETFSPVAKIKSIRLMLAIAAFHVYEIWQMDVKTAFLNEKLTEDVLLVAGISASMRKSHSLDFLEAKMSLVYMSKSILGDATYILGIKIYRDRSKRIIGLSHDTYLDKILKRFNMENSKKGNPPFHYGIKISKDLCPKTDEELDKTSRVPYASAIGSIMYAMTCTRPDVSFNLSMVSRHQQNPGEGYWITVKNILKYLRNTKDMFLVYGGEEELKVTGYCNTRWQTDKDDSRS